jgi:signal transduction histidine kinase
MRRFRLTLSFAAAAIVLMAAATIVANRIIGDDARDNLIRIAEENTARDAEHLQSMMRTGQHFSQTIVSGGGSKSGNMPGHTQEPMHLTLGFLLGPTGLPGNVTALVEGLNIVKFNLFGPDGVLLWSTDSGAIGLTKRESPLFQKALVGNVASKLVENHEVAPGISRPIDVVETYMPLWDTPSGDVIGVMEIYRDVSKDVVVQVHEAKSTVLRTMVVTMGWLFFVLLGFIVVADVSIYRSNQRELAAVEEANQRLEGRVRERTHDLEDANRRLVEAQDQLVTSEKLAAIGQLAGSLAHDLRNPLGAVKNAVYYLRKKLDAHDLARAEPRVPEFLDLIDRQVHRSNQIISDLLEFGRAREPSLSPTDLAEVADSTLSSLEIKDDIRIVKRFGPNLPDVQADSGQIQRVFTNLAGNALDAMPDGGELAIEMRVTEGFVEVSFSDTGIGIEEEHLQKIFEPLFTAKAQGTGLGLSICQQIVSKHGGTIDVTSKEGEGSTFTVRLPVECAAGTEVPR